jgi:hypothetical protein
LHIKVPREPGQKRVLRENPSRAIIEGFAER